MPFTAEEKRRRRAALKKQAEERVERDLERIKAEAEERKAKRSAAAKKGAKKRKTKRDTYVIVDIEWRSKNAPKGGGKLGEERDELMRTSVNARKKDVTPAWLRDQVRRHVKRIVDQYDNDKAAIIYDNIQPDYDSIKHELVVMEMVPDDFMDIPVKRAAPPLLMGMAQPWDRRQGTCVVDLLEHLLVKDERRDYKVRRAVPDRARLEALLRAYGWEGCGSGVTPRTVVGVFRHLRRSVGIVDEDILVTSSSGSGNRNAIHDYYDARADTGKDTNDAPVTWLAFANDHIYEVNVAVSRALSKVANPVGEADAFHEFKQAHRAEPSDLTGRQTAREGGSRVAKHDLIITSPTIVDARQYLADVIATTGVMPAAIRCDARGELVNFDIERTTEEQTHRRRAAKPAVTRVLINGDHAESKRAHEEIGEAYTGAGLNGVLRAIQKRHGRVPVNSQMSRRLLDVLTQKGIKDRARRGPVGYAPGTVRLATKDDVNDAIAAGALILDISKCYGACMYDPYDSWYVFKECDDLMPYTGPVDRPGLYVVDTKDTTVLDGRNIYTRARLRLAQDEGVAFTVTHRVVPSALEEPEYLRPCLEYIHRTYGEKDPTTMKRLITRMYGTMGTCTSSSSSVRLNTSRQQANAWFYKHLTHDADGAIAVPDANTKLIFSRLPPGRVRPELNDPSVTVCQLDDDLDAPEARDDRDVNDCIWLYGFVVKQHLRQSSLPWYIQVADYGAMRMHHLIKDMGGYGKVIYRQTDCAVAHPGVAFRGSMDARAVALGGWGGYRIVDNANDAPAVYNAHPRPALVVPERPTWFTHAHITDSAQHTAIREALVQNGGLLLEGPPGAGKSYVIDHVVATTTAEHGENSCMILAPTHTAANNVRGKTIDGSLFVTGDGRIREHELRKLRGAIKLIVVDEVSMVDLHRLRMLDRTKTLLGCPVLLVGDFNQCRAVEGLNGPRMNLPGVYKGTDLMNHIVNGAVVTLTKDYRAKCPALIAMLKAVNAGEVERPSLPQARPDASDAIHAVYTNARRMRVNDEVMQAHRTAGRCVAHVKADPLDLEAQDMHVWIGMPVISRKTVTDENKRPIVFNNERWTVAGVRSDTMSTFFTVRTERKAPRKAGDVTCSAPSVIEREYVESRFVEQFLPACAMTVHKLQGATIRSPQRVIVHQWDDLCKDLRYTALSRVEYMSQLAFDDRPLPPLGGHMRTSIKRRLASHRHQDLTARRVARVGEKLIDMDDVADMLRKAGDCPVCHNTIVVAPSVPNKRIDHMWSIDRIDNQRAHVVGNVRIVCWMCNCSHSNLVGA